MPVPLPVIKVEKSEEKDASDRKPPECWGERHTFVLMAFLGYTLCFTLRVDLAVAIVAMVNTTSGTNGGEPPEQCPPVGGRSAADEVRSGAATASKRFCEMFSERSTDRPLGFRLYSVCYAAQGEFSDLLNKLLPLTVSLQKSIEAKGQTFSASWKLGTPNSTGR